MVCDQVFSRLSESSEPSNNLDSVFSAMLLMLLHTEILWPMYLEENSPASLLSIDHCIVCMSARWENGRKQTYLPPACLRYSPNLDDHRMHQPRAGLLRVRARSERHDDLPPPQPTSSGLEPQMPGIVSNYAKFYQVKSGDSCWSIENAAGITLAQFRSWNTQIDESCTNLWVDYYVCIGV